MIDRINKNDLLDLIQKQNGPCVSIYLGTEKSGREIYKPATNLKHLVGAAQEKISGYWMSEKDAKKFLQPVVDVTDDSEFWQRTDQGLALFLGSNGLKFWRVAKAFTEQVFVSNRFFVRPILASATCDDQFYILSLSQNKAELFKANRADIEKLDVPEMPDSLEAAMKISSVERGSQVHTGSREQKGKQASVFHGHGGKTETSKEEIRYYYRQVNHAVTECLSGKRQPMVLACVAQQAAIYREMNTYPYVLEQIAAGGTDQLTEHALHARALPCMTQFMNMVVESAIESYRQIVDTTRTLSETSSILAAAHQGRIATLLIDENASITGEFNPHDNTIDYDQTEVDRDLIEDALAQTLLYRGDVFAVSSKQMPGKVLLAATLRY